MLNTLITSSQHSGAELLHKGMKYIQKIINADQYVRVLSNAVLKRLDLVLLIYIYDLNLFDESSLSDW